VLPSKEEKPAEEAAAVAEGAEETPSDKKAGKKKFGKPAKKFGKKEKGKKEEKPSGEEKGSRACRAGGEGSAAEQTQHRGSLTFVCSECYEEFLLPPNFSRKW